MTRHLGANEITEEKNSLEDSIALETTNWKSIYEFLRLGQRIIHHERNTNETKIQLSINLDGKGNAAIDTGFEFLQSYAGSVKPSQRN